MGIDANERAFTDGERGVGLTKREYFAAVALQGIIVACDNNTSNVMVAEAAVDLADRLIKALNESK